MSELTSTSGNFFQLPFVVCSGMVGDGELLRQLCSTGCRLPPVFFACHRRLFHFLHCFCLPLRQHWCLWQQRNKPLRESLAGCMYVQVRTEWALLLLAWNAHDPSGLIEKERSSCSRLKWSGYRIDQFGIRICRFVP